MTLARTFSVALVGVTGHLIEVEADIANGLPATILVGLPDTALREARDRIRAAIVNSGESWPNSKITVGLSPAALPKRGSGFDLAIAIAILAADDSLPLTAPAGKMFLAELGLDGRLRPVPGVLPAVAAAEPGVDTVVVAAQNVAEAALVPGVRVVGASTPGRGGHLAARRAAADAARPRAVAGRPRARARRRPRSWTWRRCSGRRRRGWRWRSARPAGITCRCSDRPGRARRCWPSGCRRSCRGWRRRRRSR